MADKIYSPGLEGIIAGETGVSAIEGALRYRGYSIEDLARNATFEEVAFLLLHGHLPNMKELAAFRERLGEAALLPGAMIAILRHIPPKGSMMDVMRSGASLLAHWDPNVDNNSHDANVRKAERLVAQLPTVMAAAHRLRHGQEPIAPVKGKSLAANLLWMLNGKEPSPRIVKAMDVSLVLYAEHEFNASTFTARVVASTLSDLHSAVTAAIGALKGPLHGGANEFALDVLQQVDSPEKAEAWIREALAHKQRIMGFGHRVYKDGDPRAAFLKPMAAELAAETGNQKMEAISDTIERVVRDEKKLPPNLDWPSARLYYYMGLPIELYTPLFVVSRITGWSAHIIEQLDNNRLIRPVSRYMGPAPRDWVPVEKR